jgi:hypothetical protein
VIAVILRDVVQGLYYLHNLGYVHRLAWIFSTKYCSIVYMYVDIFEVSLHIIMGIYSHCLFWSVANHSVCLRRFLLQKLRLNNRECRFLLGVITYSLSIDD